MGSALVTSWGICIMVAFGGVPHGYPCLPAELPLG